jgi:xylulokinase
MASDLSYEEMNNLAAAVEIGSKGVSVLPFGNGAERVLGNAEIGSMIKNVNFNTHNRAHVFRAAQEGIVFSFKYGIDVMEGIGIQPSVIRAGNANMFLSPIFRDTLAGVTGSAIELYDTDGAQGAARASGVGSGYYKNFEEAFTSLEKIKVIEPQKENAEQYKDAYQNWLGVLNNEL